MSEAVFKLLPTLHFSELFAGCGILSAFLFSLCFTVSAASVYFILLIVHK